MEATEGDDDCKYKYKEQRNSDGQYESFFKIDCAARPDQVVAFYITMDNWEWESLDYEYHDTACSGNCSMMQLSAEYPQDNDRTQRVYELSHSSGQTQGGFINPPNGYGYRSYAVQYHYN